MRTFYYVIGQFRQPSGKCQWRLVKGREYEQFELAKMFYDTIPLTGEMTAKAIAKVEQGKEPVLALCEGTYQDGSTLCF